MITKEISVRRKELANKYLPEIVVASAVRRVGSVFDNRAPLRGLTPEEERKYLPKLLGISAEHPDFQTQANRFWAEMSLEVSQDGTVLDISTTSDGEPVNLEDWITHKWLLKHKRVAKNEDEMRKDSRKQFFIYDSDTEINSQNAKLKTKLTAQKEFIQLVTGTTEKDKMKFDLVYRVMTGLNPNKSSREEKENRLSLEAETSPDKFFSIVKDKNLETRAFIDELLEASVLRKVGNHVFFVDDVIGATMEEAVAFLNDSKNSSTVTTLRARLQDAPVKS